MTEQGVRTHPLVRPARGQAAVGVLVFAGILGIFASVISTSIVHQSQEMRALSEKLEVSDLNNLISIALADGKVCQYVLNPGGVPLTFNSTLVSATTPQTISVNTLYGSMLSPTVAGPVIAQAGAAPNSTVPTVVISSIQLSINGAPSPLPGPQPGVTFTGNWIVNIDPSKLVFPLKAISSSMTLTVDTTSPTAAKVTGCSSGTSGTVTAAACPTGVMIGVNADGSLICQDPTTVLAPTCNGGNGFVGYEPNILGTCCIIPDYTDIPYNNGAAGADCAP